MNREQLEQVVSAHGLAITDWHGGAGNFRDLYIGVGADPADLVALQRDLADRRIASTLLHTVNREHPDFGKPMLEVCSFWWE